MKKKKDIILFKFWTHFTQGSKFMNLMREFQ